eukprot:jgi/Botrbrau1/20567/Bobra.145_2s0114.1
MSLSAQERLAEASKTFITRDGFELAFRFLCAEAGETGRNGSCPILVIEGLGGEWPEEMDHLLSAENVIRVSLGGRDWGSKEKLTPTKVAQWILALVDDLSLETVSILAAAGAGTVALACAKLMATDRLRSIGIIAGLGCTATGSRGLQATRWFCWDVQQLPWLAPIACRLSCCELSEPLLLPEPATPQKWSPSRKSGDVAYSTPVCPKSLSKALKSGRNARVASEPSLSTMSLPSSPTAAVSGRPRRGVDLARLADALVVDRLRTALLDGLSERQAKGIDTKLALAGGIYRRPANFNLDEMLDKVLAWTVGPPTRNPVEMGRINRHRLSPSHSKQNLSNLPADDSQLSLMVNHTTIIVEQLMEAPPKVAFRKHRREAGMGALGVPPVIPTTLVTAAAL